MPLSITGKRIWVAGHGGMVGSAILRRLASESCTILTIDHRNLDLTRQQPVEDWVGKTRPELIFLAAGRVGGIHANSTQPGDFLYENAAIALNVTEAARRHGVARLVCLGSSCIYPRMAPQPIREEYLLSGPLEPTNEAYAIAKIAGMKLAQAYRSQYGCDFISAMPTNLYGPGDNFDRDNGHVLPAMIRRFHEAMQNEEREVRIWGSGEPRREFLHVDDCADAVVFLAQHYSAAQHVNVGMGTDISIMALARLVADIVGYRGEILVDRSRPDGMPQKLLSTERLNAMGWRPRISLEEGIRATYGWYCENISSLRGAN